MKVRIVPTVIDLASEAVHHFAKKAESTLVDKYAELRPSAISKKWFEKLIPDEKLFSDPSLPTITTDVRFFENDAKVDEERDEMVARW